MSVIESRPVVVVGRYASSHRETLFALQMAPGLQAIKGRRLAAFLAGSGTLLRHKISA